MSMRYPGGLIATSPVNARYPSGVWTQAQAAPYQAQNVWTRDQFWPNTTLLLQGDGAVNGAQNNTFLDSSSNNFTITRNGNTTQGAFTPYEPDGYWSNYFDGSGDNLTSSIGSIASGASFTFEFFAFFTGSVTTNVRFFDLNSFGFAAQNLVYRLSGVSTGSGAAEVSMNGSQSTSATGVIKANVWQHHAVSYNGTTLSIFVDGTRVISYTPTAGSLLTTVAIGSSVAAAEYFTGYMSNFRLVIGSAVYTPSSTTITIPSAPLTAITNTSLLTCQSNRFKDNSTNNFTLTVNGNTSVQAFQPFPGATTWSASVLGGSGYFDGSGDYLNGPTTGQFAPTGDFTISMWFYPTSFAASYYVLAGSWNAGASDEWLIQYDNTGAIRFLTTTDSTFSAAGVVKLNQWQFLSISRSGSTVTGYINGTSFRSYTLTGTVGSATKAVYVGIQAGTTWPYVGYISDYRLVAGSAQSATPPTSPATAISGTNTLLSFTNAGIYDNSMMNNLETVGNTQVSTSVVKYGTGSMAFDGSGDYLVSRASTNNLYAFGTGDFTIEFWLYLNSTGQQIIWDGRPGSTTPTIYYFNSALRYYTNAADQIVGSSLATGQWYHIAISRSGTSTRMFINGTQSGSTYSDSTNYTTSTPIIGADANSGSFNNNLNGYIDDLRITKGAARYITTFTPPPARLPAQ